MTFSSFQIGAPEDERPADISGLAPDGTRNVSVHVASGAISVDATTGVVTQHGVQRINTGEFQGQGIVGNARTPTGSPRMNGAVQPTDRVVVNGMEMTVASAERLGAVMRDASGRYVDVAGSARPFDVAPPQEQQPHELEAHTDSGEALPNTALEQELTGLVERSSPATQLGVMGQLIESGELHPNTISRVASELHVKPEEISAQIERVTEGFREQAAQTVRKLGSEDPELFFEWANANRSKDMKQAMRSHAMERSTKAYEPLYRDYLEHLDQIDPEAVLAAEFSPGVTAHRAGNTVVLNIPGRGQLSYRAALKAGIIRVIGA